MPHDAELTTEAAAPDTTPVDVPATEVVVETPEAEAPVDADAAALAAFDQGVAEVTTEAPKEPDALTAADVAAAAAAEKVTTAADAAPPAAGGAPLVIDHAKTPAADVPKVEPDPETDAAVTELGLKGKAETRFREMAGTIKTQAQEIEPLRAEAARARQWEEMVTSTKAPPEQFGQALGYLSAINSGDPAKMGQAFDFLMGEIQALGKNLGREVPGLVDPLSDHPDLAQEVQFGEMPRARALEIAQHRTTTVRTSERDTRTATEQRQQAEFDTGMASVKTLADKLKAEDPDFDRKLAIVAPLLDTIRQTNPPAQWADKITDVYNRVKLPPVAATVAAPSAARPPVGAMPLRATGAGMPMQKSIKDLSEMDAFNAGLESVGR